MYGVDFPGRFGPIRTCCLVMAVIGLAYSLRLRLRIDLSYEIYLVHMVVINIFIELGFTGNNSCFIIALIVTVFISVLMNLLQKIIVKKWEIK